MYLPTEVVGMSLEEVGLIVQMIHDHDKDDDSYATYGKLSKI